MRRLALVLFLLSLPALGQLNSNTRTIRFAGAPSGPCSFFMYAVNNATGDLYDCKASVWFKIGPASGSGSVTGVLGTANQITSDGSSTTPTLSIPATFIAPGSIAATTTLGVIGATSGTATFTAPAVAGTSTNPVVMTNVLQGPTGTSTSPTFQLSTGNTGFYGSNSINCAVGTLQMCQIQTNEFAFATALPVGWGASFGAGMDTAFSRDSAGVIDIGTGAAGSKAGTLAALSTNLTDTAANTDLTVKNTTAAVVGTSQGSPVQAICGRAFHGSADVEDCLTLKELPGNGNDAAITFTLGHTGTSTGAVTTNIPGAISMNGSTSGVATITPPATAGTATNAVISSNSFQVPTGSTYSINTDLFMSRSASGIVNFGNAAGGNNAKVNAAGYQTAGTKFTTNAGCGETAGANVGSASAGKITTAGSTSCTTIITLGSSLTAASGWSCWAHDLTTSADYNNPHISSTTTTATIVSGTIVAADVLEWGCIGY